MVRKALFLALLLIAVTTASAYAKCQVCTDASAANTNWPQRSANQLIQGCANTTLGWTQAFTEPFKEDKVNPNKDTGYKMGNGVLKGWGKAVMSFGAGLMEAITCWTPVRIIPDTGCPACEDLPKAGKTIATGGKE